MHVEQDGFYLFKSYIERLKIEVKGWYISPVFSLQDSQHLSDIVEALQASIISEQVADFGEMFDVLLFKSIHAEIWQCFVLLLQLFEVVVVRVGFHQIDERPHTRHVDGVHLRIDCFCVLVVLLFPIF